jgi:hypothetical protein
MELIIPFLVLLGFMWSISNQINKRCDRLEEKLTKMNETLERAASAASQTLKRSYPTT